MFNVTMLMGSRKPTLSPHPGEISCCQQSRLDNVSRGKWGVAKYQEYIYNRTFGEFNYDSYE